MLSTCKITEIFYLINQFLKEYNQTMSDPQLREDNGQKHRKKPNRLFGSEVINLFYVCKHLQAEYCSNLVLLDCYLKNNRHKEMLAAHDDLANWIIEDNPVVLI